MVFWRKAQLVPLKIYVKLENMNFVTIHLRNLQFDFQYLAI